MLIHKTTQLPYKGVNLAKEFGGKTWEKDFAERMKRAYSLLLNSRGYSIISIKNPTIQLVAPILSGKVMQK